MSRENSVVRHLTKCAIACFSALIALCVAPWSQGQAHSLPDAKTRAKLQSSADAADRYRRMQRFQTNRLSPALQRRAIAKVSAVQEAIDPSSAKRFRSRFAAFPFTAKPELKARGATKTVAVMVDFSDMRGDKVLPGLTPANVAKNVFGEGTAVAQQKYSPFESLHNYYKRSSENKLEVGGDVFGWVHLNQKRWRYQPAYPDGAGEDIKAMYDNRAIFKIVSEALSKLDASVDFAKYDNDGDGDIDLVTIMYAGPNTGWGNFWWAYRWQFFIPEAADKLFDGKRLRQFVFEFVSPRSDNPNDFDPTTLIHEYGHALGLADYYDYCSQETFAQHRCSSSITNPGPDGDIGGLDMMSANMGNHNAISRWLLDWIEPRAVSGEPETIKLAASGMLGAPADGAVKAVAVFPKIKQSNTPANELFLIENRTRVGNDAGAAKMPTDGIIVWHVDATPNADKSDFSFDNSYTEHKFVQLVRAGSRADFSDGERATSTDYYTSGKVLNPTSVPNSSDYAKRKTGISLTDISTNGTDVSAKIGVIPEPRVAAFEENSGQRGQTDREAAPPAEAVTSQLSAGQIEETSATYEDAKTEELASQWPSQKGSLDLAQVESDAAIKARLLLAHWATRDGKAAANAVLQLRDSPFQRLTFSEVMMAWANENPREAEQWYFADAQAQLRQGTWLSAGRQFAKAIFKWRGISEPAKSAIAIDQLRAPSEIYGAVEGLREAATATGSAQELVAQRLKRLEGNKAKAEGIFELQNANKKAADMFGRTNADLTTIWNNEQ